MTGALPDVAVGRQGRQVALRVWLQEGHDGEPGVEGHGLDFLGFATWAPSEAALLAKLPVAFAAYAAWRARHGLDVEREVGTVEVVGRFTGDEILFPPDREPAGAADVDLTVALLEASRADLVALVEGAPPAALDWDPPYERFALWADWRTIRANLAHVANGETHYYLRNLGYEPVAPPADPAGDWRVFLPRSRAETLATLARLRASDDLRRVGTVDHGRGAESWSVRKALRRLVRHELVHTKSIARILRTYRAG